MNCYERPHYISIMPVNNLVAVFRNLPPDPEGEHTGPIVALAIAEMHCMKHPDADGDGYCHIRRDDRHIVAIDDFDIVPLAIENFDRYQIVHPAGFEPAPLGLEGQGPSIGG